ncbi:protein Niban 2b isoform X1 [Anguilla rostrata]|uniref:protein Niban 2b isoform X1 n=1 Tax=Anguilla rostrata TaxID=7938 RepID=UPI0030D21689
MGDVISTHLDEGKREMITARTGEVMGDFGRLYEQQYALALVNSLRFEFEGNEGPQPQLLHRKVPLKDKSIFSGALFQYLEENKKWRNRFFFVPDTYKIQYFENKMAYERGLQPKATINCAGYRVLTSMDQYVELLSNSLPGVNAKASSSPFLKCATKFPLILWHPYARHFYFCVTSEKEQEKWHAVFQDCVRHTNDGLSEECKVQTPAFTDAVRLYRQGHGQYGTWDMMCGVPPQILANLVMETLLPELRDLIAPRLKGKMQDRQRNWMLISDAVYGLVLGQTQAQYEAIVQRCEAGRPPLETSIRTDMDQIITSKEHVTNKMRAVVLPKAEELLKSSIRPYISSILDDLMEPTSRGFSEVRDVFFRELVEMSKNTINEGSKEKLGEHMEKISMLAFHPVKMQTCYEKVEQLQLEGLQQRFDVSSPSVFVQRAQILMREQMDNAVYTFEKILHQSLEDQGSKEMCKIIQHCQDRVIKKYDYDSSTVRKKFFREALLQIVIPYMLKQLTPSCAGDLPPFQELIFEDLSRYILVENVFEEVVLQSVMKDIMMAVKEAAVQRRHNLYRDSIVLTNSDPNLHLLGEKSPIDWAGEYGGEGKEAEEKEGGEGGDVNAEVGVTQKRRRVKQVVSMIQLDGAPLLPHESCLEVPGVDGIPEESEVDAKSSAPETGPPALANGTAMTKSAEDKAALPNNEVPAENAPQEAEHSAESAKQETESKPPAESVEQETKSPTESSEQEVESKPPTESAEQEAESKPPTEESAEQEVESKPPTESAKQEVESKPPTESAEQEVEGKPTTESAEQEVESKPPTEESAEQEGESKPPTESAEQEVESKPPTESAEQEAESKPPTESAEQEAESKPPTESAEQEAKSKQPTENSPKNTDSSSAIESAIQEIDNAVQGEESGQPSESTEKDVAKTVAPKQEEEVPPTGPAESSSEQPPEPAQQDTNSVPHQHDDSGFQSPTSEAAEEEDSQPITGDALTDSGKGGVAVEPPQSNSQTQAEAS